MSGTPQIGLMLPETKPTCRALGARCVWAGLWLNEGIHRALQGTPGGVFWDANGGYVEGDCWQIGASQGWA